MRNFGELLSEIGRLLGRPDNAYRAHIRAAVNLALEEYVAEFWTPFNRRRTTVVATGEQQQGLPQDVDRPVWFLDLTHAVPIEPGVEWDRYYPVAFANADEGAVLEWQLDGVYPTIEAPAGAPLTVSGGAGDARSVVFRGSVADSASSGYGTELYTTSERVFLNGSAPVRVETAFLRLDGIATSDRADAPVVVRKGDRAIAVIEPGEVSPQYVWVRWLRVPPAGTRIALEYVPRPPRLRDDDDPIPAYVPARYLVWAPLAQLATDMNKDDLAKLALLRKREIVQGERMKQLAFGDLDNRATPLADGHWNAIGVD